MKFTIGRDNFASLTAWAASALAAKPAVPAAAGILITAAAGTVTIMGNNYDSAGCAHVTTDIEADGSALVPGRFLAAVAGQLPNRELVTVTLDGPLMHVECGPAKFRMPVMDAVEYPAMPEMPPPVATMAANDFAEAVTAVACAASADDTLALLTAICVDVDEDGTVVLMATDRYRVHTRRVPATLEGTPPEATVLIPAKVLAGYAKGADGKVTFCCGGSEEAPWAGFADGGRMLVTRPLAGEPIKWHDHVTRAAGPEAFTVTLDAALTVQAADRCSLAAEKNDGLQLEFGGDGTVSVSAARIDGAAGAEIVPGVTYDGAAFVLRVNPKYLTEALKGCESPRAQVTLVSPSKPLLVTPGNPDGEDGDAGDVEPLARSFASLLVPLRPQA